MKQLFIVFILVFFMLFSVVLAKDNSILTNDQYSTQEIHKQTAHNESFDEMTPRDRILAQLPTNEQERNDRRPDRRDKIQEMIAFRYVEYLDLTEEQSAKFFPLLNEYNNKRFEIMHQRQGLLNEIITEVEDESISTKVLSKKLDEIENLLAAEIEEVMGFYKKTEKFLDDRQSIKLHIFEEKLKNDLFNQFRDRDRRPPRD